MDQQPLETLRGKLIDATRQGFDVCRRTSEGQTIYAYAFGLCSQSGGGLQPWCQTEESFAKKEARWGTDDGWVGYRRYCPEEWWVVAPGRDWGDEFQGDLIKLYKQHRDVNPDFTLDLLVDTLKALDADGYFGSGSARDAVTLMVYVSDEAVSEKWWLESVRRLNSPAVAERFRKALDERKR